MDAEKVMNVEMKELTPADVHDDKDAEKDGMKGTAAKNEEEEGEVEEKEDHVYSKLKNPKEEIYCLAEIPVSTPKPNEAVPDI